MDRNHVRSSPTTADPDDRRWLQRSVPPTDREARKLYERLRALCFLADEVQRCHDYRGVADLALDFFGKLLAPERSIVSIAPPDEPAVHTGRNIELGRRPEKWPVSQSLLKQVRAEHQAVFSHDAQADERLRRFASVDGWHIRAVLCVPLGTREQPRGLVYLDSQLEDVEFDQGDLYFLTTVCRLLDGAIENVRHRNEQARRIEAARRHLAQLRGALFDRHDIVGRSAPLLEAYQLLEKVASRTDIPILLLGESGTGKELFAKAAHDFGACDGPLVATNLAAINANLVESELFGHCRGAFTGASEARAGLLEKANGGTLFLDEVADIPLAVQPKLLRALENGEFAPVGGSDTRCARVRLVSATSRDLAAMVAAGTFREDLYYRIRGMQIVLPSLRERREDIPLLAEHFAKQAGSRHPLGEAVVKYLQGQPWPGNVRQLRNLLVAAVQLAGDRPMEIADLEMLLAPSHGTRGGDAPLQGVEGLLAETERNHMLRALERAGGVAAKAAEMIGMTPPTFSARRKRYGI